MKFKLPTYSLKSHDASVPLDSFFYFYFFIYLI